MKYLLEDFLKNHRCHAGRKKTPDQVDNKSYKNIRPYREDPPEIWKPVIQPKPLRGSK